MKFLLGYFAVFFFGVWLLFYTHLTVNGTQSLPYHGFFCVKGMAIKRGDLVCLKGHETAYTPDISLTKRLLGLPGDIIEVRGNHVFVVGKNVGPLQKQTKDGRPLTPLKARMVPKGFVFLSADHPRSFDSRYEEFGLVPESIIQGRCFGLFRRRTSE
jgi:conjugal transfer pilin signal peptidase TrbI